MYADPAESETATVGADPPARTEITIRFPPPAAAMVVVQLPAVPQSFPECCVTAGAWARSAIGTKSKTAKVQIFRIGLLPENSAFLRMRGPRLHEHPCLHEHLEEVRVGKAPPRGEPVENYSLKIIL